MGGFSAIGFCKEEQISDNLFWICSPRWPIDAPAAAHGAGDLVIENGRIGVCIETNVTAGGFVWNTTSFNSKNTLATRALALLPVPMGTAAGSKLYWTGALTPGTTIQLAPQKTVSVPSTLSVIPPLDPPPVPVPTTAPTGGTVPAGLYGVVVTYVTTAGETAPSAPGTVVVAGATSTLTVPAPPLVALATGWNAYITQPNGGVYTLQTATPSALGAALTLTAAPTSTGASPPTFSSAAGVLIGTTSKAASAYGASYVAPVWLSAYPLS